VLHPPFAPLTRMGNRTRPARIVCDRSESNERVAVRQSMTIRYRRRHNKMTTAIKRLLAGFNFKQGTHPDCRYDVLIENYDFGGRDLLVEVKPDADRGGIRIAIGQLLDYRRFVRNPAATDFALLTILPPHQAYREFLLDLQISPLWFTDEHCQVLDGEGMAWDALREKATARRSVSLPPAELFCGQVDKSVAAVETGGIENLA
jgi:hypothetical protein